MELYEVTENTLYKDFALKWIEYHKNFVKMSTYANYKQIVYNKLVPFFGEYKIKDLNKKIVQRYIIAQTVTTRSIKDDIVAFKQSLNYLFENELIAEFSISKLKFKPQQKNKVKFFDRKKYLIIKQYCIENFDKNKDLKAELGVLIALNTGMRIGEICGLKFKDIDFENNLIFVNRTLQRIYIPGEKGVTKVIIGTPKSNASVRAMPLTNDLKSMLQKLDYEENHFVIRNEKYMEPRLLRNRFNVMLKELAFEHIKFHSLRHTFATLCISSKIDIKTTSELLGHANAKMTLDIYTHTTMEQKRDAIKILQNL